MPSQLAGAPQHLFVAPSRASGCFLSSRRCPLLFISPGPPVAGEEDEWKRRLIGQYCPVDQGGETTTKTMEAERIQRTTTEVSRTGPGVTNPRKPPKECGGFQWKGIGVCGVDG